MVGNPILDKVKKGFFPSCGHLGSVIWMHHMDSIEMNRTMYMRTKQREFCMSFGTILGSSTSQNSNIIATYLPSQKVSKMIMTFFAQQDKFMSHVFLCTSAYRRTSVSQPENIYIQQLWADTRGTPVIIPRTMNDRNDLMIMIYIYIGGSLNKFPDFFVERQFYW